MAISQTAAYLIVSSDSPGATWDSGDPGSQISINLSPPIRLTTRSLNRASLVDASIFFSSPNIGAATLGLGNSLTFSNSNALNGPIATNTITFAEGLYSLDDINTTLSRELLILGYGTPLSPMIVLSADNGAQRILLTVTSVAAGITINFSSGPNEIIDLLGFAAADLGPTVGPTETFTGGLRANFSQGISSYVINVDAVSGSYIGGTTGTALANIPLDASPNSQIILRSPSSLLNVQFSDQTVTQLRCWITDQAGRRIILREPWSFSFVVEQRVPGLATSS